MPSSHRLNSVTLEFLRSGQPHNQLLSKITEYFALCGNQGAEVVHVPYDHAEYENRIQALHYQSGNAADEIPLMAGNLRDMLSSVPGLGSGLAVAADSDMTHLRLVLTPHELALLPFEFAYVPKGAPGGESDYLLLKAEEPVTLTRRIRGVSNDEAVWPTIPRILFAWASPPGVGSVPYEAHLLALRRALADWVSPYSGPGGAEAERKHRRRETQKRLTILPEASIDDVYRACAETAYTHVHLLAHGIPTERRESRREVGLALVNSRRRGELEIVEGRRLANALRFREPGCGERDSLPAVVTVASCNSAQVRSVITHGASLAQDLHAAGVPFVLASQFPLSVSGSVAMTEELYRRLLRAEDPRVALHHVRRRLFSLFGDRHDWASIVSYAALPGDLETQLERNQYEVARQGIDRILAEGDILLDRTPSTKRSSTVAKEAQMDQEEAKRRLLGMLLRLDDLEAEVRRRSANKVMGVGVHASTEKRRAELLYSASTLPQIVDSNEGSYLTRSIEALKRSREFYWEGTRLDMSSHWLAVQYLSLTVVLGKLGVLDGRFPSELWTAAKVAAEMDLESPDATERAWALADVAELYLLKVVRSTGRARDTAAERARRAVRQMVQETPAGSFTIYSTRRQFSRYSDWWELLLDQTGAQAFSTQGLAFELHQLFPAPMADG